LLRRERRLPADAKFETGRIPARTRNALVFSTALFLLSIGAVVTYITIVRLLDAERYGEVELQIEDYGKGIAPEVLERSKTNSGYLGVGLVGMRERVRELGGHMEVHSGPTGTRIVATLPLPQSLDGNNHHPG
jgi:signal transduction histidine kinase